MPLISHIRWRPTIGDPTIMGWVTVAAYFATALLAAFTAGSVKAAEKTQPVLQPGTEKQKSEFLLWIVISAGMLMLAVNKQLDLQSLFTDIGRVIAKEQNWYEKRRSVQAVFIALFTIFSCLLFFVATRHLGSYFVKNRILFVGIGFLLFFIVIRAASMHHVEEFLSLSPFSLRMNWILELGGIGLIAAGAVKKLSQLRETRYYHSLSYRR